MDSLGLFITANWLARRRGRWGRAEASLAGKEDVALKSNCSFSSSKGLNLFVLDEISVVAGADCSCANCSWNIFDIPKKKKWINKINSERVKELISKTRVIKRWGLLNYKMPNPTINGLGRVLIKEKRFTTVRLFEKFNQREIFCNFPPKWKMKTPR